MVLAAAVTLSLHLAAGLSTAPALYETLRVFVLDADTSLGRDAPDALRAALWLARFTDPVLTAGLAAELVHGLGLFHLPSLYLLLGVFPRNHVVVAGLGRLGRHLVQRLARARVPVVVVERDAENDYIADVRRLGVPVILGDAADPATLRHAGLRHAAHLLALTSHDLVNLDVALVGLACRKDTGLHTFVAWAHLAEPTISENVTASLPDGLHGHFRVLDTYVAAAKRLVGTRLDASHLGDVFVVAGLGRFGAAVLAACLDTMGADPRGSFVAIDSAPGARGRLVARGCDASRVELLTADMLDESVTARLREFLGTKRRVHFFVCTDHDEQNLQFALAVRARLGEGDDVRVITRTFQSLRSRGDALLLRGVEAVEFVDLLEDGWPREVAERLAPPVDARWAKLAASVLPPEVVAARPRFRG